LITFASLGVHKKLVTALSNEGIEHPFPIQSATLPEAINGRDVLGRGETGSGKTLAFGLTVLTRLAFEKPAPGAPYVKGECAAASKNSTKFLPVRAGGGLLNVNGRNLESPHRIQIPAVGE